MNKKWILLLILLISLVACQQGSPQPTTTIPDSIRAVRVDYPQLSATTVLSDSEENAFKAAGINLVAVGAGRVDWAYFPWTGHRESWSQAVKDSGVDFVARDVDRFSHWAQVSLVVDVLSPAYITQHPAVAAVSWNGIPSVSLVSLTTMTSGEYSDTLLAFIEAISQKPDVRSITLVELVYYVDGFGADDLAVYLKETGTNDWPRLADGTIDIDSPAVSQWRTQRITAFLEKAASIVHANDKELWLEVKPNSLQLNRQNWTEYTQYLTVVDRLLILGNSIFTSENPGTAGLTIQNLDALGQGNLIYEIGAWKDDDSTQPIKKTALTTVEFNHLVTVAFGAGIKDFWLTPSYFLNPDFWQILDPFLQAAATAQP